VTWQASVAAAVVRIAAAVACIAAVAVAHIAAVAVARIADIVAVVRIADIVAVVRIADIAAVCIAAVAAVHIAAVGGTVEDSDGIQQVRTVADTDRTPTPSRTVCYAPRALPRPRHCNRELWPPVQAHSQHREL